MGDSYSPAIYSVDETGGVGAFLQLAGLGELTVSAGSQLLPAALTADFTFALVAHGLGNEPLACFANSNGDGYRIANAAVFGPDHLLLTIAVRNEDETIAAPVRCDWLALG